VGTSPFTQLAAIYDINNSNQFIGVGLIDGVEHGFVGQIVPEPSSLVLLGISESSAFTACGDGGLHWFEVSQMGRAVFHVRATASSCSQKTRGLLDYPSSSTADSLVRWRPQFRHHNSTPLRSRLNSLAVTPKNVVAAFGEDARPCSISCVPDASMHWRSDP
jgi:hypothetical protein